MVHVEPGQPLNLIFDADDTLWDSNIHFLEAFDSFCDALRDAGLILARAEIQAAVRGAELKRIQTHGYGRKPYMIALADAVAELAPGNQERLLLALERIGTHLIERHCELLPDVEPTLQQLAARHRIMMFTKGQRDEQLEKLQ